MLQDVSNFSENQKVTLRTDKHQTAGQTSVVTVQSRWQLATLKTVTRELHAPQTRGKPSQKCNGLCCVMVGMRKTISANWLERLGHTRGKPPWQLPASHTHTHGANRRVIQRVRCLGPSNSSGRWPFTHRTPANCGFKGVPTGSWPFAHGL